MARYKRSHDELMWEFVGRPAMAGKVVSDADYEKWAAGYRAHLEKLSTFDMAARLRRRPTDRCIHSLPAECPEIEYEHWLDVVDQLERKWDAERFTRDVV
jgi:hypothetical protein